MLLFKATTEAERVCVYLLLRTSMSRLQSPHPSLWPFPSSSGFSLHHRGEKVTRSRHLDKDLKVALFSVSLLRPPLCLRLGPCKLTLWSGRRQGATRTHGQGIADQALGGPREARVQACTGNTSVRLQESHSRLQALPIPYSHDYINSSFSRQRKGAGPEREHCLFLMIVLEAGHRFISQSDVLGLEYSWNFPSSKILKTFVISLILMSECSEILTSVQVFSPFDSTIPNIRIFCEGIMQMEEMCL